MRKEELPGRAGKEPDGSAKTRQAYLGCVFTQHRTDEEGHPVRDYQSTTYVSSFSPIEEFGPCLRQDAIRRGLALALQVVLLIDGAEGLANMGRSVSQGRSRSWTSIMRSNTLAKCWWSSWAAKSTRITKLDSDAGPEGCSTTKSNNSLHRPARSARASPSRGRGKRTGLFRPQHERQLRSFVFQFGGKPRLVGSQLRRLRWLLGGFS